MAEEVVKSVGEAVDEVEVVSGQRGRASLRWTSAMSSFVLRRMCQLISTGVRTDKGFKEVHLNQVAKYLTEFSGIEVTGTQVYNHLRKWRQRWVRVSKLRELSGALWDEETCMITLEDEHYKGHVKAHPKDADYLNKPIENYQQMMIIFGNGMATGKFAMGSNAALGTPSVFAESTMKTETLAVDLNSVDMAKLFAEVSKTHDVSAPSASGVGQKRKRTMLNEEGTVVLTGITDAVNNVADAIRETKVDEVHPELYGAVMYMPGFSDDALIVAFSHLVDNKAQGIAFVGMSEAHRVLWMRTFLAKHYNE